MHPMHGVRKELSQRRIMTTSSLPGRQASEKPHKNEGAAMVLYFSGTGNSRYLARCIAEGLGKTELTGAERI